MYRALLFLSLLSPIAGCASAEYEPPTEAAYAGGGCFRAHLEEAIALNRERMDRYAEATGGDSTMLSLALIASEKLTLLAADRFDDRGRAWQAAGVPVVCDLFVPMSGAPDFAAAVEPPAESYQHRSGTLLAARLGWTYAWSGAGALFDAADAELDALADIPSYHCMERHVLESIRRAAYLGPIHREAAAELGLPSPHRLSRDLIATQLAGLPLATGLDRVAAPLQAAGVPILCNDVPAIDLP